MGKECRTERKSGGVVNGRAEQKAKTAKWVVITRLDEEDS